LGEQWIGLWFELIWFGLDIDCCITPAFRVLLFSGAARNVPFVHPPVTAGVTQSGGGKGNNIKVKGLHPSKSKEETLVTPEGRRRNPRDTTKKRKKKESRKKKERNSIKKGCWTYCWLNC